MRIRFCVGSESVLGNAKYACLWTDDRRSPIVCTIEPKTRAGNRFSGRNQFCAERSHPLRILAAAAVNITAREACGLFSETRCCDIQPFCVVRQTARDARPRFSSPEVSTYSSDSPALNIRRQFSRTFA